MAKANEGKSHASTRGGDTRAEAAREGYREAVARTAYLRAEARGFIPGHEEEDWLAAEQEVLGATQA